jgi:hypothetical protein
MSLGCSQKLQKGWGTHVLRVLSTHAKKVEGALTNYQKRNYYNYYYYYYYYYYY